MIFIANNINPMKRTIVQSSHLKCQLEDLNPKADNCTLCSLDIINMYPSIKAKLIRKAVSHFSQGLNEEEKNVIEAALEMQKFSMANTLIQFREKYYEYGEGGENALKRTLMI